jgi:cytosine/adenosine deaminase-related metal-dependent hydrolase
MLSRSTELIIAAAGLLAVGATCSTSAQQVAGSSPNASAAIAFVNVNLIPMDRERVVPGQTVVIRGDHIIAIGPTPDVAVPTGATVVDGAGRYLMPGLTDAHVHLPAGMPWAPTRPDFGDAPLYLAYGVYHRCKRGRYPDTA